MALPLLESFPDRLANWSEDHAAAIVGTVVLAVIAILIVRTVVPHALRPAVARQAVGRSEAEIDRRSRTLSGVIVRTAEAVIITLALFTVLPEFGFDIRAVLAGVSITSIAIGLGAQSLVKDALNGIFILTENQYAVGDIVTVANVTGTVEDVTLRRTVVRDIDGIVHSVPNGSITTASNHTRDYAKLRVTLPVPASTDLAKARDVIDSVGRELAADEAYASLIVAAPHFLRVDSVDATGGATLHVSGTVAPGKQWEVAGALRSRLLAAFARDGIRTLGG